VAPAARVELPACAAWWEHLEAPAPGAVPASAVSPAELAELRGRTATAYEAEVGAFALLQRKKHGSDQRMVQRLTSAGTAKDRIAALTLQVHESSFHALPFLRQLLALCERPTREVKLAATEAAVDLFLTRLLPPRALLPLERQKLPPGATGRVLLQAHFEDELKRLYAQLAAVIDAGTRDSVAYCKQRMIGRLYATLTWRAPELDRNYSSLTTHLIGTPC
jgi:hypothetical protein